MQSSHYHYIMLGLLWLHDTVSYTQPIFTQIEYVTVHHRMHDNLILYNYTTGGWTVRS